MERDERYYENRNRNSYSDNNNDDRNSTRNLSNYSSRYSGRGNYYGMPDSNHEYRNVKSTEKSNFGNNTSGPVGGYGASSYRGNFDDRNSNDRKQSYRGEGDRDQNNYNYGSMSSSSYNNDRDLNERYRYGDPNPYMRNKRNRGGYEQNRGTGWDQNGFGSRNSSYATDNSGDDDRFRYRRQENSYSSGGQGRKYSDYGRDEGNFGYNHGEVNMHNDRDDHDHNRWQNNYDPDDSFGNRNVSRMDRNYQQNDRGSDRDNYATGMYSSNRAYLADQGRDRDDDIFDNTDNNYPSRSNSTNRRSGPDYSTDSPLSNYKRGEYRG